jgi:hypothetical protein
VSAPNRDAAKAPPPRLRPIALLAATCCVAIAGGSVLAANGSTAAGVLLILVGVLLVLLVGGLVVLSRALPTVGTETVTGRTVARPPMPPAGFVPTARGRWVGGANIETRYMRLNVSMPLAVVTLDEDGLHLRFRPAWMVRAILLGAPPSLDWQRHSVTIVYPVRGKITRARYGIAIRTTTELAYFWTWGIAEVMATLEGRGYPVSWQERSFVWFPS